MGSITFDMSDRTALVTGASSGIGRQLCLELARAGARVVAVARRREKLESLVEQIEAEGGAGIAVAADATDALSLTAAYDQAERSFGLVDTVYANAGIHQPGSSLEISLEDFGRVLDVNLKGVLITAREAARRLLSAGGDAAARGRIVIVSSIRGVNPIHDNVAYCSSKAAAIMAGKVMALEWAESGINVNMVCPGVLVTELSEAFFRTEKGRRRISEMPRKRMMELDDLMSSLMYFGADQCRAITGSVLVVDDGQTL